MAKKPKKSKWSTVTINKGETESVVISFNPQEQNVVVKGSPDRPLVSITEQVDGAVIILKEPLDRDLDVKYKIVNDDDDDAEENVAP